MSSLSDETHFDKTGTLHKPGPIGRIVRLLLGGWLLYGFWIFWTYPGLVVREELPHSSTWLWIAAALWLIPPVVNIGFGINWRAWPRYVAGGIMLAWAIGNVVLEATGWSPGLGRFTWLFCLYVFGHLGLSFVLAAVIATPGCEMRAIPHLWSLLTGRETREHFCPGFLHGLDAWENARGTEPA